MLTTQDQQNKTIKSKLFNHMQKFFDDINATTFNFRKITNLLINNKLGNIVVAGIAEINATSCV